MRVTAIIVAALVIFGSPLRAQSSGIQITSAERVGVLRDLEVALDSTYVFPEVARRLNAALRDYAAAGEYDHVTRADEFAELLTKQMRALTHDLHLGVSVRPLETKADAPAPRPSAEERAQRAREQHYGFGAVKRLDGNIAYLQLKSFGFYGPGADAYVDSVMSGVADAAALIIDLRGNNGGHPGQVARVLSYLFGDDRVHLNTLYWRVGSRADSSFTNPAVPGRKFGVTKPVFVLTDHETFSAAEEFAYDLQSRGRAMIIGERTGGGAHPGRGHDIGTYFNVFVPEGRAINPVTGTDWEGKGVIPDLRASAQEAFELAKQAALKRTLVP